MPLVLTLPWKLFLDKFSIKGGFGIAAKTPSLLYLHPETAYFEFVHYNSMAMESIPEAQRLLLTTTYAVDTENPDLKLAKNQKTEIGFRLNLGKLHMDVTAFEEKMKNGYSLTDAFKPMTYKVYEQSGDLPADGVSFPTLKLTNEYPVLLCYNTPKNNITINSKGVELEIQVNRIDAIRTAFSVNGHIFARKHIIMTTLIISQPLPIPPNGLMSEYMKKEWRSSLKNVC